MKYCKYCGNEIADNEKCTCAEAVEHDEKVKKITKLSLIIGSALSIIIILIICFASSKINPFNADIITFTGVNGYGEVNVDMVGLIESAIGEEPTIPGEEMVEWYKQIEKLSPNMECSIEPSSRNLSNGDKVTLIFKFTGEAADVFKSCKKSIKVKGLKEVEGVDVFKNVKITFNGMSGNGSVKIETTTNDEFINALNFETATSVNNGKLSNGDKVEIVVYCDGTIIEQYDKAPQKASKTVTVSGLKEYATPETIPVETFKSFANQFAAGIQTDRDNATSSIYTYSKVEVCGMYFAVVKEDGFAYNDNEFHIIISYKEYVRGKYSETIYLPLVFENLILNKDGSVDVEYTDGQTSIFAYDDIDKYLNELKENYTVTEIK